MSHTFTFMSHTFGCLDILFGMETTAFLKTFLLSHISESDTMSERRNSDSEYDDIIDDEY